jgi:hypothetical protein
MLKLETKMKLLYKITKILLLAGGVLTSQETPQKLKRGEKERKFI